MNNGLIGQSGGIVAMTLPGCNPGSSITDSFQARAS